MIRKIHLVAAATAAVLCAACDTHIDVPDTAVRPGHILCEDGTALPYAQYEQSGKKAIAVVFDTEKRGDTEGDGYAVYLWDIAPQAFADSLGIAQGTSADIMAYDGNENTFALYDTQETASPMAEAVFDLWRYGQSAYILLSLEASFLLFHRYARPVADELIRARQRVEKRGLAAVGVAGKRDFNLHTPSSLVSFR